MDRRNFFKKTALAGAGAIMIPEILKAAMPEKSVADKTRLGKNSIILFQGDSITDAGRKREDENKPNAVSMLGWGYAALATANLLANYPEKSLNVYNRGISGNKVFQLQERWQKDCLALKPDVVSILIGVNDYWHTLTQGYEGTLIKYEADYRDLVAMTIKELPLAKVIICEPFILDGGSAIDKVWEPAFSKYREASFRIARDFDLTFVPFQKVFNEALKKAPAIYWGPDGVHPTLAGAQLMAQTWLKSAL